MAMIISCENQSSKRIAGPIKIPIKSDLSGNSTLFFNNSLDNKTYPAVVAESINDAANPKFLYLILPEIKPNTKFILTQIEEDAGKKDTSGLIASTPVQIKEKSSGIYGIEVGNKPFSQFIYNNGADTNRPCMYPVLTPKGVGVTRNYPLKDVEEDKTDHIHHTGVWTAWGDLNKVDNWAYGKDKGTQTVSDLKIEENPVYSRIIAKIDWKSPEGALQVTESRIITIYNIDGKRIVDFDIDLKTEGKEIKFGDTKEGGFLAVRVASSMDVPVGGMILNSKGKESTNKKSERKVWGKQAEWCDYSGEVDGNPVGVTIMDYPNNVIYPTYWHVRNYGLMTANPFGKSYFKGFLFNGSYKLPANQHLRFQYRLFVHDEFGKNIDIAGVYNTFTDIEKGQMKVKFN